MDNCHIVVGFQYLTWNSPFNGECLASWNKIVIDPCTTIEAIISRKSVPLTCLDLHEMMFLFSFILLYKFPSSSWFCNHFPSIISNNYKEVDASMLQFMIALVKPEIYLLHSISKHEIGYGMCYNFIKVRIPWSCIWACMHIAEIHVWCRMVYITNGFWCQQCKQLKVTVPFLFDIIFYRYLHGDIW